MSTRERIEKALFLNLFQEATGSDCFDEGLMKILPFYTALNNKLKNLVSG